MSELPPRHSNVATTTLHDAEYRVEAPNIALSILNSSCSSGYSWFCLFWILGAIMVFPPSFLRPGQQPKRCNSHSQTYSTKIDFLLQIEDYKPLASCGVCHRGRQRLKRTSDAKTWGVVLVVWVGCVLCGLATSAKRKRNLHCVRRKHVNYYRGAVQKCM